MFCIVVDLSSSREVVLVVFVYR